MTNDQKILLVEDDHKVTLAQFIAENRKADVYPLMLSEIEELERLAVDEVIYIGFCEIKRIA